MGVVSACPEWVGRFEAEPACPEMDRPGPRHLQTGGPARVRQPGGAPVCARPQGNLRSRADPGGLASKFFLLLPRSQLSVGPQFSAARRPWGLSRALSSPARSFARPPCSPPGPQGLAARYLRPQPDPASLPVAVAAPSRRPTRPAARRRAVPGQRPCQPRPPAPLPFPSPLQPMCGQSRPRAADPAVNPAQGSGPAFLSPLGATPGVPNVSRVGAPAPEDAPEAASA